MKFYLKILCNINYKISPCNTFNESNNFWINKYRFYKYSFSSKTFLKVPPPLLQGSFSKG